MIKLQFICLLLLISAGIYSQNQKDLYSSSRNTVDSRKQIKVQRVSASTGLFILNLQNRDFTEKLKNSSDTRKEHNIIRKNGIDYINAFVKKDTKKNLEKEYGFLSSSASKDICLGLIPIARLQEMSLDQDIFYIDIGTKNEITLDSALIYSNIPKAHQGFGSLPAGHTGKDVIVGIIDTGFDYSHPTFSKTNSSDTRILRVWEQRNDEGIPPSGFQYGSEYIGQSVVSKWFDLEDETHGTHVAGIAAGNGKGINGNTYKGVAFESDIILVSTNLQTTSIADGINYIFECAAELGKPCVINLSLGSNIGPHDGTSMIDSFYDGIIGQGKIIVGSAGNSGSSPIFIEKTFSDNDSILATYIKFIRTPNPTKGTSIVDIWGEEDNDFEVKVALYDINTNTELESTDFISSGYEYSEIYKLGEIAGVYCEVQMYSSINFNNYKKNIIMQIDNSELEDDYIAPVVIIKSKDNNTKMWTHKAHFTAYQAGSPFENGVTTHTVCETGGTGNSIISVGAYSSKNHYTSFMGESINIPFYSDLGEIAIFSSKGPTADGRTKPDICAPGNVIISSVSSLHSDYNSESELTVALTKENGNECRYASMQGTSMSSPLVTGIVALLLEANSELTPDQALATLKNTAKKDEITGEISEEGSNIWGWGKANAYSSIVEVHSYPTPFNESLVCNTSFETWSLSKPSCWYGTKSDISAETIRSTKKHFGKLAISLINPENNPKQFSSKAISIENEKIYEVTYWAKGQGDLRIGLFDERNDDNGNAYRDYNNINSNIYTIHKDTIRSKNSTDKAEFIFSVKNTGGLKGDIIIDDVTIKEYTPTNINKDISTENSVILYPNPAKSTLNIWANSPFYEIEIISIEGRKIMNRQDINSESYYINTENMNDGIYFIKIKFENQTIVKKFTVSK